MDGPRGPDGHEVHAVRRAVPPLQYIRRCLVASRTSPLRENAGANGCLLGLYSDLTKLKEAHATNFYESLFHLSRLFLWME